MNFMLRKPAILRPPLREAVVVALAAWLVLGPPSPLASPAGAEPPVASPLRRVEALRSAPRRAPAPQPRPHGVLVPVEPRRVSVKDGDTFHVWWGLREIESVRILGVDAPEIRDPSRGRYHDQPYGRAALRFARRAFAASRKIEILRAATLDPYGRSLAYVFLDGRNYSVLLIAAHLAEETVSRYGSNGFPREAAAVRAAARKAGPPPFESPGRYRRRARERGARVSRPARSAGSGRVPGPAAEAAIIVEDRTRGEPPCR